MRQADARLESWYSKFKQTIQARAAMIADIRRNVRSSADVSREARRVENDSGGARKYWHSYEHKMAAAILGANALFVIKLRCNIRTFRSTDTG